MASKFEKLISRHKILVVPAEIQKAIDLYHKARLSEPERQRLEDEICDDIKDYLEAKDEEQPAIAFLESNTGHYVPEKDLLASGINFAKGKTTLVLGWKISYNPSLMLYFVAKEK